MKTLFSALALVLLSGCLTPLSTTTAPVRFVTEDRDPIKGVTVTWRRKQQAHYLLNSKTSEGDPLTTNKEGIVNLPRHAVKSSRADETLIEFAHPEYFSGTASFTHDGLLLVSSDEPGSSLQQKPFLTGSYVIVLTRRRN